MGLSIDKTRVGGSYKSTRCDCRIDREGVPMADLQEYRCEDCGKKAVVNPDDPAPDCCGKTMSAVALEPCIVAPADPEHSRPMEDEDACDDHRAG